MDMNRVGGGAIVYVILICALAIGYSEGRRMMTGTFLGNGAGWVSPEIDEDTAEQMWMHCGQELRNMKEAIGDSDMYVNQDAIMSSGEINSKAVLFIRRNMHKAGRALPTQVKQSLLACLRKKKLQSGVSQKDVGSKNWIFKCLELFFSCPSAPRRNLIRRSRHPVVASHAPSPAPALAPAPTLEAPSYGPAPSSTPSPNPQPPIEAPEQPSLPPDVIPSPAPSKVIHSAPRLNVAPDKNKNNHDDEKKRIIVIIAATAVGTFVLLLAALLLFCCLKGARNKIDPQDGQKDEKPLLTLSLSDFSTGSSQKSHSLGNSSNKDFGVNSGNDPSLTSKFSVVSDAVAETTSPEGLSGDVNASASLPPLKPPPGRSAPLPPGLPSPPPPKPGPRPPPPPIGARPPPPPPTSLSGNSKTGQPSPLGPHHRGQSSSEGDDTNGDSDAPKAKLKPFFWDKVLANPESSMVWNEISAGSFQFNEEMIETLFGYNPERNKNNRKSESSSLEACPQYIQIIDSRKAQNLSILLRALNVSSEEVCDALGEGYELPTELVQTLLKMAPTTDEELKLRLFSGDPSQLGPAERFLKVLVEIPFAFKRLESLLFISSLQEEVSNIKESFVTLEVACKKLRNSRLFLKLLEAVLKTGNRMNDGTYRGGAQAFKLDSLLKLSDVKGTDGKTTLLHFVVQEIIRSEGVRAARTARESQSITSIKSDDFVEDSAHETAENYRSLGLQVVSGVSTELEDVKKAAMIDTDGLTATVSKLSHSLMKTQNFLNFEMKNLEEDSKFCSTLSNFVKEAEVDITWLLEEDKRIMALLKSTADYFHGHAGKDEGLHLFVIVRDFLVMLDKECKEVRDTAEKRPKMVPRKEASALTESSREARKTQLSDIHQRLFPAIKDRRMDSFSSDDDSPSP